MLKALFPLSLCLFFLSGCDEGQAVHSGFKDPSTFVIVACGKPKATETDGLKRRYEAKSAALLLAQKEMVDRLKGRIILDQEITTYKFDAKDTCWLTYTVRIKPGP